jgi:hypothetical protein
MGELLIEQDSIPDGEATPSIQERTQQSQSLGSFLLKLLDAR